MNNKCNICDDDITYYECKKCHQLIINKCMKHIKKIYIINDWFIPKYHCDKCYDILINFGLSNK